VQASGEEQETAASEPFGTGVLGVGSTFQSCREAAAVTADAGRGTAAVIPNKGASARTPASTNVRRQERFVGRRLQLGRPRRCATTDGPPLVAS
jgi:hypothetical protein